MQTPIQRFREKFGTYNLNDTAIFNGKAYTAREFVEEFITEEIDQAYQRGRENAYSDRDTLPSETLHAQGVKEAYQRGKEEGMAEEAINCHEHCEQAKREVVEEIILKVPREQDTSYDNDGDSSYNHGWNNCREEMLEVLSSLTTLTEKK